MAAVLAGICAASGTRVLSQNPDRPAGQLPTFTAEVEYVEVDAFVTDQRGGVVRGLRKEDFQIYEDGRRQTIRELSFVEIPVVPAGAMPAGVPVEPDVETNERPFAGRVYVLVLDALHTLPTRSARVKRTAREFIERYLGENDRMAVVTIGGGPGAAQEFTSSRRLLLAAVDRFMGVKLESATLSRNTEFFRGGSVASGPIADPADAERAFNALASTRVLTEVARKLGGIRGRRKSVLFLSEGIDYDITDVMNNRSASSVADGIRDVIAAAARANASIYAIDPRGLAVTGDEEIEAGIFADQRPRTYEDDPSQARGRPGIGTSSLGTELQLSQDSLRVLAEETNGFAAVSSNDFGSAFDRIVRGNSAYYVLAYYPSPDRRDGKFHKIDVRVAGSDLSVRARKGYVAPRTPAPSRPGAVNNDISSGLRNALNSPVPTSGVTMSVFAAPFRNTGSNASVVLGIELSGRSLALVENQQIELAFAAVDSSGETRGGDNGVFTLRLPEDVRARVRQSGIRFLNRLALPGGRYHFRVAARDVASGAVGALSYDLDVPDFDKLPLAMSGLLVSSSAGAAMPTARADARLQELMSSPPVSRRAFPVTDDVSVVAEIYDRDRTPHTVDVSTVVRTRDGEIVYEHSDERSSAELHGGSITYVHAVPLPVGTLRAGRYVLTIEARSRLGKSVKRELGFEVTP